VLFNHIGFKANVVWNFLRRPYYANNTYKLTAVKHFLTVVKTPLIFYLFRICCTTCSTASCTTNVQQIRNELCNKSRVELGLYLSDRSLYSRHHAALCWRWRTRVIRLRTLPTRTRCLTGTVFTLHSSPCRLSATATSTVTRPSDDSSWSSLYSAPWSVSYTHASQQPIQITTIARQIKNAQC